MPRILIAGADGQVGWELRRGLPSLGEVIACNRAQLDLASPDCIRRVVRENSPTVIINAAAYTAVDRAESEPEVVMAINGTAPGILAEEAKRLGAVLVHYSTDYVFDGTLRKPYREDDPVNPLNVYGRTKLAGEQSIQQVAGAFLIFRTNWVYGSRGKNFFLTVLRLAAERPELRIVNDQIGTPTWCRFIAATTRQVLSQLELNAPRKSTDARFGRAGIYNLTCKGQVSWYEYADEILRLLPPRHPIKLTAITSAEFPAAARRPSYSVLSTEKIEKTFSIQGVGWHDALRAVCDEFRFPK
jgi:dTDP-4-dehydrorhamnose reductase